MTLLGVYVDPKNLVFPGLSLIMLAADRIYIDRLFQAINSADTNACLPKLVRVLGKVRSPTTAERS